MTKTTDALYGDLTTAERGTEYTVSRVGAKFVMNADDLRAAMLPVVALPMPAPVPLPVYISQWSDEANARINDCGPSCVAMTIRSRGDRTPINALRTDEPTGLTDAVALQATLKAHGVESALDKISPTGDLAGLVRPYSIMLVNYAPIARYSQDVGFKGWHWLVYIGRDPANPANSLVLDPDYWGSRINEGDHKSLPTSALRAAFQPYLGVSFCTAIAIPDIGGPALSPVQFVPHDIIIGDNATPCLNIRAGAGTNYAKVGQALPGERYKVVDESLGWFRIDGTAGRWISALFTKPALSTPVDNPPISTTPTMGAYGRHYLGSASDTDLVSDNYPIAKAVDQPSILQRLHVRNPNGLYIFRHWYSFADQDAMLRQMQADMPGALNRWFADNAPFLAALPFAYHEGLNEVDGPPHYLEFERQRTERLATMGIKACVLNISVARSDAAMWQNAKAMVDAVNAHGGIVGEHSYAMGLMSNNAGASYVDANGNWQGELFPAAVDVANCWTGLRIMQSRKTLAAQGQGQTRLVATELGLGDTAGPGRPGLLNVVTKGWRDCIPLWQRMGWLNGTTAENFYVKQLKWWADTTGCMGTAYSYGTGGDPEWNVDDVRGAL